MSKQLNKSLTFSQIYGQNISSVSVFKIADNGSQNKEKICSRMSFIRNDGR